MNEEKRGHLRIERRTLPGGPDTIEVITFGSATANRPVLVDLINMLQAHLDQLTEDTDARYSFIVVP